MIKIYTGLPRSGKTYLAVKDINDEFIYKPEEKTFFSFLKKPKKEPKYKRLYTNIGGFKHDQINEVFEHYEIDRKSIPLKWDIFYNHLKKLRDLDEEEQGDESLIAYADKYNLYKSLIVIDEAHKFFDKKLDTVLVWFLGYHGHMGMDIILITQNKVKLHSNYLADSENFVDAQPKSKSFGANQLRYFYYASSSYTDKQRFDKKSILAK